MDKTLSPLLFLKLSAATVLVGIITVVTVCLTPMLARATPVIGFNPGNIIDQPTFTNSNSMSVSQIQAFLNSKVPICDSNGTQPSEHGGGTRAQWAAARGYPLPFVCLKDYTENGLSAAQIIYNTAQAYGINPQVLIVLLQKEQGLVTDTWPVPSQYRTATGYGCPDSTPGVCASDYYGFTNQVQWAAKMFHAIVIASPTWYTPYVLGNNYIQWSPNSSCGGSTVNIINRSTQALYNYTPYQPNQAALNDGFGSGDGCSAHGNRNFYLYFTSWFGPTQYDGFSRVISDDPNDGRQWVVYRGVKQYIPSTDILSAWNMTGVPLITQSSTSLASLPTGPNLGRVMKSIGGNYLYLVDNGKRYRIASSSMLDIWNLRNVTPSIVTNDMFTLPTDGGDLVANIRPVGSTTTYLVEPAQTGSGTTVRPYANGDVYAAREGTGAATMDVTPALFSTFLTGPSITTTKVYSSGTTYQLSAGKRLWQKDELSTLYGGNADTLSVANISRFDVGSNASSLIQSSTSPVYLLNDGVRYPLTSGEVVNSWINDGGITRVTNNFLNLIPQGSSLGGFVATNKGNAYIINQRKLLASPSQKAGILAMSQNIAISDQLLASYPSGGSLGDYIKSNDSDTVYVIDDSGTRRQVNDRSVWSSSNTVSTLSYYIVNALGVGPQLGRYVTDGTTNYLVDNGKRWTVSGSVANEWRLANPQSLSVTMLSAYPSAGVLADRMRDAAGTYFIIKGGTAYATVDSSIAGVWTINDAPFMSTLLPYKLMPVSMLTRFVRSDQPGDGQTFAVDRESWYAVNPTPFANLGGERAPVMTMNPIFAPSISSVWNRFLVKSQSGATYVIDNGTKHPVPSGKALDTWTSNGAFNAYSVSDDFLALLPTTSAMTTSIKGAGPGVFTIFNGSKRMLSPSEVNGYLPYTPVSEALINSLPTL